MTSPSESRKVAPDEISSSRLAEERRGQEQGKNDDMEQAFPLVRQTSIYSLTLDEIQNAVCEPGKSFGSMNMDEFLANIWNVEDCHAPSMPSAASIPTTTSCGGGGGLMRQGSLTLPPPLCRKTVDEVWSEIQRGQQQQQQQQQTMDDLNHPTSAKAPRQPTFGEMTLEDFLIRAGVVREGYNPSSPQVPAQAQQYVMPNFQMGASEGPGYGHVMGMGLGPPATNGVYGSACGGVNGKRNVVGGEPYFGGAMMGSVGAGGNGCGSNNGYSGGLGSPVSPVSSDGMGAGQVDNSAVMEAAGRGGRKRSTDGVVDKVVERRQRRMIKNRESAARSRARKQAYTIELEAELNLLKEENQRLRDEERKVLALRKQLLLESMAEKSRKNARKTVQVLRHCKSCCW